METTFNTLATGERDERDVVVHGRVLTARRLGSVLFLSVDSITSFVFYPLQNNNNNTQAPPTEALENYVDKDVFIQMEQLQGENLEFGKEEVLQVAVVKEDFNGEVRLNKDGTVDIYESLKEFSRIIAMGHTVEIVGKVERSSRGQLRVSCFWAKIVAKDRSNNKSQIMSKEDRDFQGHLPLCLFFRRGQECTKPTCTYRHEFKDERERLNAINMQMRHKQILKTEKDPSDPHPTESKKHRHKRAELFVDWLIETFKEKLNETTTKNILDIAGGRGTVSLLLLNKEFNCVLVEPRDHKFNPKKMKKDNITIKGQFTHMQCRLDDDFLASPEGQQAIEKADIVIGMHPDEATEAIFDLALKFKKPFAVVPCCVFPSLFPRTNKAGNPVVTYFEFVDYLLEKDPGIQVGFLGFQGRTKVLYKL